MMQEIDKLFEELVKRRESGKEMGISPNYKGQLAWKIRNGKKIDLETKLRLLRRAGYSVTKEFTRAEMNAAITFTIRTSATGREMGAAYLLEKWLGSRS